MIDLDNLDELGEPHEYREGRCISVPICNGCKNKDFDENGNRICIFREIVISDDLQSKNCIDLKTMCKDFEADEESCWYTMILEHVEEAKKKAKK